MHVSIVEDDPVQIQILQTRLGTEGFDVAVAKDGVQGVGMVRREKPSLILLDIPAIADVAHAHGLPLIIDNTVPSPYLCNPLQWGADIVVHSATKYLGGYGTTLAGVVVESGRFPWDNGKFPGMTRSEEHTSELQSH